MISEILRLGPVQSEWVFSFKYKQPHSVSFRKACTTSPACLIADTVCVVPQGVPVKACMSVADTVCFVPQGVPAKACMSVADCSESSVLRSCTLGPYVPLRRTPSESVSAIRHAGLWRRDAAPASGLQPDTLSFGAGTHPPAPGVSAIRRFSWSIWCSPRHLLQDLRRTQAHGRP